MKAKPFTQEEKQFILDNFATMTIRQMAAELNRSEGGVKTWVIRLGLRRRNRLAWTPARVRIFEELYPHHSAREIADRLKTTDSVINARSRHSSVRKAPEYLAALNKKMGENLQKNGFGTRFGKGQKPWCYGKKIGSHPNSAETQFQKGHRPHNKVKVGTILPVSRSPYLKIKIAEPDKWEFLHRHNWEQVHGQIPQGCCLWFKDQNPKNCTVENLDLVSRKELRRRTSIKNLPSDLQAAYRMLGRLTKAIRKKEKRHAEEQN